jgi:hypothetical protein
LSDGKSVERASVQGSSLGRARAALQPPSQKLWFDIVSGASNNARGRAVAFENIV